VISRAAAFLSRYGAALLSGLLLTLGFPNLFHPDFFTPGPFIACFALVPLLLSLDAETPAAAFKKGYATGFLFFILSTAWINHIKPMGPGALPAWLSLSAYLALYPAAFAGGLAFGRRRGLRFEVLWIPALWTLLEFAREILLSGFPWLSLGSSQAAGGIFLPLASLCGVYGLDFVVLLLNLGLALALRRRPAALAAALLLAACFAARGLSPASAAGPSVKVAVLQGNVDQDQAWTSSYRSSLMEIYGRLMRQAADAGAKLLIWPESALPAFFNERGPEAREVEAFAKARHVDVLLGSSLVYRERGAYENGAVLVGASGEAQIYVKRHLVPFGEYIPLRASIPALDKTLNRFGLVDFKPGPARQPGFRSQGLNIAPLVCYESIYGRMLQDGGAQPDLIAVVTLDTWFGNSAAPRVHFLEGALRAVENGAWTARSAATGISGFISPQGRATALVPLDQEGWAMQSIPSGAAPTFYRRHGPWFLWLCLAFVGLAAAKPGLTASTN
jgi:apolipoprotein N-acyltransferase